MIHLQGPRSSAPRYVSLRSTSGYAAPELTPRVNEILAYVTPRQSYYRQMTGPCNQRGQPCYYRAILQSVPPIGASVVPNLRPLGI